MFNTTCAFQGPAHSPKRHPGTQAMPTRRSMRLIQVRKNEHPKTHIRTVTCGRAARHVRSHIFMDFLGKISLGTKIPVGFKSDNLPTKRTRNSGSSNIYYMLKKTETLPMSQNSRKNMHTHSLSSQSACMESIAQSMLNLFIRRPVSFGFISASATKITPKKRSPILDWTAP